MTLPTEIEFPKNAHALLGDRDVIVRWVGENGARTVEFVPVVPGEPATKTVNISELAAYTGADKAPETIPDPLPEAAPDADTQPVEIPGVETEIDLPEGAPDPTAAPLPEAAPGEHEWAPEPVAGATRVSPDAPLPELSEGQGVGCPEPLDELQQLRAEVAALKDANAALLDDVVESRRLLAEAQKPAPVLARKEFRTVCSISDSALANMVNDGWTIELMQFTRHTDAYETFPDSNLNAVFSRTVAEPAAPPQPEARASAAASLTADFVADTMRTPLPEFGEGQRVGFLNKQPDSPARTDALYRNRKRIVGQRKAGQFIARANAQKKRSTFAQNLADAGLPISAQLAATGLDDTKSILNAQAYEAARARFLHTAPLPIVPLMTGG